MTVAGLVIETIALMRAYRCTHRWAPYTGQRATSGGEPEEQCQVCGIVATAEGKRLLRAESIRRGFGYYEEPVQGAPR